MKSLKKIMCLAAFFVLTSASLSLADEPSWETAPGHHNQSVLLGEECNSAEDTVYNYARGSFFAEGSVEIENLRNGNIYVSISTLAYQYVDKISHTAYLDVWNDNINDWVYVDDWEFEKTKEEANNELSSLSNSFTLTGYETDKYYRVRGLHTVELGTDSEGCSTETDGVKITDN